MTECKMEIVAFIVKPAIAFHHYLRNYDNLCATFAGKQSNWRRKN